MKKKGENTLIGTLTYLIIAVLGFVLMVILYGFLSGRLFNWLDYIKDIFHFG
jgi:hypothetical protein